MTPFQQFQVWLRRASTSQRAMAGVAAVVVIAVLGYLVAPSAPVDDPAALATTGGGGASGAAGGAGVAAPVGTTPAGGVVPGAGATPGAVGAPGATDASGGALPGTGAAVDPGAVNPATGAPVSATCPAGTDQGATEMEMRVAITIINIAGAAGNATIGVPTPETQQSEWDTVIAAVNAEGGAGCRQIVPEYYNVNPLDTNGAQQQCLAIAESGPFVAIDTGALIAVGASDCIPNQQIPMIGNFLTKDQLDTYAPYYIAATGIAEDIAHNGYLALAQQGYFGDGFQKLGLLTRSCIPALVDATRSALHQAGVPDSSIVEFSLGCPPGGQNTPVEFQQAVLTFKNAGVTHVTEAGAQDFYNFVTAAAAQGFVPQYVLVDDKVAGTTSGTSSYDASFDGAVNITSSRYGEEHTPGFVPSASTQRCNEIFAGSPPVYEQQVGYGGVVCRMIFLLKAVVDNAPAMQRNALTSGMTRIGTYDASFPAGPIDYAAVPPGTPYGLPNWRTIVFSSGCSCFTVPDPTFQPSFQ